MATITHVGVLSDSSQKTDFYAIIDNATLTSVVDADIAAAAAIADTKLAQITTSGKVAVSALPSITPNDAIVKGLEIKEYDADATSITVKAGTFFHGSTYVSVPSATAISFATSADWWDGHSDTYAAGAGWNYVGISSAASVRFLGENPPNKADTSGTSTGTLLYWYDTAAYWRVVGAVRMDTDDKPMIETWQSKDMVYYPESYYNYAGTNRFMNSLQATAVAFSACTLASAVPRLSTEVEAICYGGTPLTLSWRPSGSSAISGSKFESDGQTLGNIKLFVSSAQAGEYKVNAGDHTIWAWAYAYRLNIR